MIEIYTCFFLIIHKHTPALSVAHFHAVWHNNISITSGCFFYWSTGMCRTHQSHVKFRFKHVCCQSASHVCALSSPIAWLSNWLSMSVLKIWTKCGVRVQEVQFPILARLFLRRLSLPKSSFSVHTRKQMTFKHPRAKFSDSILNINTEVSTLRRVLVKM